MELTLADCPPELAAVLALGSAAADSDGAFSVYRAGPVGRVALDPSGGGQGLGRRAGSRTPPPTGGDRLLPLRRRDLVCRVHRGGHVVDARTGRTPVGIASVTVGAASLTDADIDATAAYAQGDGAASWLGSRPGRTGPVVWADGSTTSIRGAATVLPWTCQIT